MPIPPQRRELLDAIDTAERLLREIATTYPTELSGITRWLILRLANRFLRLLIRAGRR